MKQIDWENPFTAEDWKGLSNIRDFHTDSYIKNAVVAMANARFRELLEQALTVQLTQKNGELCIFNESLRLPATHSAKLVAVKKLLAKD